MFVDFPSFSPLVSFHLLVYSSDLIFQISWNLFIKLRPPFLAPTDIPPYRPSHNVGVTAVHGCTARTAPNNLACRCGTALNPYSFPRIRYASSVTSQCLGLLIIPGQKLIDNNKVSVQYICAQRRGRSRFLSRTAIRNLQFTAALWAYVSSRDRFALI